MRFLRFVLAVIGFMLAGAYFATPAFAAKGISATIGQSCGAGKIMIGGTFTLTGIADESQRITVNTKGARAYSPSNFSGDTATYAVEFDAPLASPPAVATVPSDWSGSFSLTNAQCTAAKAPTISVEAPLCNTRAMVMVNLTNHNPIWVKYTATISGLGSRSIDMEPGEKSQLDFQPVNWGSNYTLTVKGADGTNSSQPVSVPSCQGSGPVPTTKKSTTPKKTSPPESPAVNVALGEATPSASAPPAPEDTPTFNRGTTLGDLFDRDLTSPIGYASGTCCVLLAPAIWIWWSVRSKRKATATP